MNCFFVEATFEPPLETTGSKKRDKSCQTKSEKTEHLPITDRALKSDKKCLNFTSIPLAVFNQILLALKGKFLSGVKIKSGHTLSEKDQLLVFYNKVKTNNTNGVLALTFGFNAQLVSKVFKHVEKVLFEHAKVHFT